MRSLLFSLILNPFIATLYFFDGYLASVLTSTYYYGLFYPTLLDKNLGMVKRHTQKIF